MNTTFRQLLTTSAEFRETLEPSGWLGLDKVSGYARCLTFLLGALNWKGVAGQVCEALPHMPGELDRVDFINTMVNLGFHVRSTGIRLQNFDARLAPCLFSAGAPNGKEAVFVLLTDDAGGVHVYNPDDESILPLEKLGNPSGILFVFQELTKGLQQENTITANVHEKSSVWFRNFIRRFDPIFRQAFFVSLIINFLALASSLFVMVVYDKVIGSRSTDTLTYLVLGALLAIGVESLLRYLRARSLAFFGVRIDAITTTSIFERLMFLPPRLIEGSSIPSQVARIKDFDSIREFFSGPTGITILELPFTLIFIITIALIGGRLALVPLALGVCYTILGLVMLPRIKARTEQGATASVAKQALLVETMKKIRAIKSHGLGKEWLERFRELSGEAAVSNFHSTFLTSLIESFAYGLSVIAGLSTLSLGIWLVWQQEITAGGLIASMMLIWRVLTPMQSICNSLLRIRYIFRSISQVHKLFRTPPEGSITALDPELTRIKGDIEYKSVGLRYSSERSPVIAGLSLAIEKGEIVAVAGHSGAGKSSLLKITSGLYSAQMGSILIDGIDIRQRDSVELRKNISYAPQIAELFHGSIEKNLRMAKPDSSDQELYDALTWAGALETVNSLPKNFNTFIGDYRSEQLSTVFAFQLNLARAYLRDAPIMLFDEFPSAVLNGVSGELFREYLAYYRGRKTIFFVTDRRDDVLLADRLLYLPGNGQVLAGEPAELLEALQMHIN